MIFDDQNAASSIRDERHNHSHQLTIVAANDAIDSTSASEPAWRNRMTPGDWRGLAPLIYHHINPYSRIELDVATRLPIAA